MARQVSTEFSEIEQIRPAFEFEATRLGMAPDPERGYPDLFCMAQGYATYRHQVGPMKQSVDLTGMATFLETLRREVRRFEGETVASLRAAAQAQLPVGTFQKAVHF